MENLKTIVEGAKAMLPFASEGKVYQTIETENHQYQLEVNSIDNKLKST